MPISPRGWGEGLSPVSLRGLSNADIAQQLGISPSAVKLYLSTVFEKLGAASRAEAVAIALKRQLLKL